MKQGYGHAYLKHPFNDEYMKLFREYETQAREQGLGLWGEKGEIQQAPQQQEKIIVYITKTGTKYHGEGCQFLRKSKIPISLEEWVRKGYTPCSVCKPPVLR